MGVLARVTYRENVDPSLDAIRAEGLEEAVARAHLRTESKCSDNPAACDPCHDMHELLISIVRALIEHPDEAAVYIDDSDWPITYRVRVEESDLDFLIGEHGRTARAIRTLTIQAAMKLRRRVRVVFESN